MVEVDLHGIEAELHAVFPLLTIPSSLFVTGSGFDSIVIEAGGEIIFRIGKNSIAQEGYEKERICLPILAPHIPFLIPEPKWYIYSSPYFPFGVIGYHKIPGLPLQLDVPNSTHLSSLASDVARFLLALHHTSPDSFQFQGAADRASAWELQYQEILPFLKDGLTHTEFGLIRRWWDNFLLDKKMQHYRPVLQHGDLWYENMLVNTGMEKLVGIIDWERLSLGDPSQGFATLFDLGEKFVRRVIQAYRSLGGELDENFEYRMQRLWEAREFEGLHYAVRFDDPIEFKDALRKLRHGPILESAGGKRRQGRQRLNKL